MRREGRLHARPTPQGAGRPAPGAFSGPSSSSWSPGVSTTSAATRFSSRRWSLVADGIGTIYAFRESSEARAICAGAFVAPPARSGRRGTAPGGMVAACMRRRGRSIPPARAVYRRPIRRRSSAILGSVRMRSNPWSRLIPVTPASSSAKGVVAAAARWSLKEGDLRRFGMPKAA